MGEEKGSELVQFNHAWDISITPTDTGDSGVKRNGLPCITLMVLQGSQMLAASIRRAENERVVNAASQRLEQQCSAFQS